MRKIGLNGVKDLRHSSSPEELRYELPGGDVAEQGSRMVKKRAHMYLTEGRLDENQPS
ncbi:uncharacterized protein PHALS_09694 [Plasmopara halstedii]|uniref:Uncharacterized protein n=1 Tax=Plasmopara halstedii TaxID=4781 RepID=A0A0P1AG68_PLAHL|nr:uncharacterized protein PHALS_09694 [Plasmopara halstedii]CEG39448.1 hypothetical protein PHALS_09694 [Plasmopara halstedii]|eukprot:XP_024575817.1 hypothetical protein PHALS_09694 [Plasmopara halstedii]